MPWDAICSLGLFHRTLFCIWQLCVTTVRGFESRGMSERKKRLSTRTRNRYISGFQRAGFLLVSLKNAHERENRRPKQRLFCNFTHCTYCSRHSAFQAETPWEASQVCPRKDHKKMAGMAHRGNWCEGSQAWWWLCKLRSRQAATRHTVSGSVGEAWHIFLTYVTLTNGGSANLLYVCCIP